MRISEIITQAAIAVRVAVEDKAHALKFAAESLAARSGLSADHIREALAARESLGSTGIGQGVAVPHVCVPGLDRPYALFMTLAKPIGFDAIDDNPVDLICAIISPPASCQGAGEPISHLAAVVRILRDKDKAAALRKAKSAGLVYDIIEEATALPAQCVS